MKGCSGASHERLMPLQALASPELLRNGDRGGTLVQSAGERALPQAGKGLLCARLFLPEHSYQTPGVPETDARATGSQVQYHVSPAILKPGVLLFHPPGVWCARLSQALALGGPLQGFACGLAPGVRPCFLIPGISLPLTSLKFSGRQSTGRGRMEGMVPGRERRKLASPSGARGWGAGAGQGASSSAPLLLNGWCPRIQHIVGQSCCGAAVPGDASPASCPMRPSATSSSVTRNRVLASQPFRTAALECESPGLRALTLCRVRVDGGREEQLSQEVALLGTVGKC